MALAMSLEVQRTIDYLKAVKERPKSEVSAERRLARRLREIFKAAAEETIDALDSSGVIPANEMARRSVLRALEEAIPALSSVTEEEAIEAARRGRNKIIDSLRKAGFTGLQFDDLPQGVIDRIRSSVFTATERTMRRLVGDVNQALEQGFSEGLGIDGIKELLEDKFTSMADFELNRIARTEVQSIQNAGAYQTIQDLGIEFQEWVTAGDERVRESHIEVEGEIVAVGTPFSNGLLHPLDPNGPLEEWVNCRCRAVPFIVPLGKAAPGPGPFREGDLITVEG